MIIAQSDKWKNEVLIPEVLEKPNDSGGIHFDEFGILRCGLEQSDALEFHEKYSKGAFLRKLKNVKNHQISWETPYYFKLFDCFLKDQPLSDSIFLDIGCGDGRVTEYLLNKGARKIVCIDFDYEPLRSLSHYLDETGQKSKVLLIHSDFENIPVYNKKFDIIFALRTLYYTNEKYELLIKKINHLLIANGLLIISDPNLEGFVLRALLFDSLNEALNTFEKRRFKEVKENTDLRFRIFTQKELLTIYSDNGFNVEDTHGITMWHNLLRILLLRGQVSENELDTNKDRLTDLFDFLDKEGSLFKDIVWKLKKNDI